MQVKHLQVILVVQLQLQSGKQGTATSSGAIASTSDGGTAGVSGILD